MGSKRNSEEGDAGTHLASTGVIPSNLYNSLVMNGNHRVRSSAHDSLLGFDATHGPEWKVNKIAGLFPANETQAKSYYVQN